MLSHFASFVGKSPKTVIFIVIAITLIFATFIPSLKMGTTTKDFMPDNKIVKAEERINEYFGKNTEPVMIILHHPVNANTIRQEYTLMKKLENVDGVTGSVGVPTFVSAVCGMEYQKGLTECSDEEIMDAYEDMISEEKKVAGYNKNHEIVSMAEILPTEKNIKIIIETEGKPLLSGIEWFVSFKNRVDPAHLNLTYMISARLPPPHWDVGSGMRKNIEAIKERKIHAYMWVGKDGNFVDFPLNATVVMNGSRIEMEIPRKELGRFGIAPSFGNASLPAKLYDIKAGSRVCIPFPFSINTSIIRFFLREGSIFHGIVERFNATKMLEQKNSLSPEDFNRMWKTVDEFPLEGELLLRQPSMDELKNSALSFISRNKATLLIAEIDGNIGSQNIKKVSKKISEIVDGDGEVTGSSVISYQIDELTDKSNKIIMPGIFIAIIAILILNFRKPSYMIISMLGLSIAIVWLFGTMALTGIKFNTIAIALVPLMMGLGVDYSVHIFHNYIQELRKGKNSREAIIVSIKEVGLALILATITTGISFLSFLSASIPSVRNFGILAAVGIAYTFIVAITLEASIRYILDRKKKIELRTPKSISVSQIMGKISDVLSRNPWKVVIVVAIITVIMGSFAVNVKTSFSMAEFMPENSEAIKAMKKLPSYFPSAGKDEEYILIEGNVATVEALKGIKETMENIEDDDYVARLPDGKVKVDSIYSIIVDAINKNESLKEKFDVGEDGIPSSNNMVKNLYDYLYKYGKVKSILHKNNGMYDATLIRIYTTLTHLENSNRVMKKLYSELKNDVSHYGNAKATVTGDMVLIYTIMSSLTQSQWSSTILCIIVAGIVIMIAYRKFVLGLLTMVPVIISSIWILGTIYIAGYTLNVMTVMITSLTIGLGITYAIHVVERFRLIADRTGNVLHAVEEAVANTGQAVMMAALTTIAGFSILIFSPMPPEQQFGFITAMTILYSFITTILIIPPLLIFWGRWRKRKYGYIISNNTEDSQE